MRAQRSKIDWPETARRVAALLPLERFPAVVRRELTTAGAGTSTQGSAEFPVAIAFSGGADSLALLLTLWAHFPDRRGTWIVLHFNHRLRGAESAGDARFCRAVCRALGVRLVNGAAARGQITGGSEAAARAARFEFFHSTMQAEGARRLVLGHHRDDVLETMLLRLARGAGLSGLASPRAKHTRADGTTRLRPLLDFSKTELCAALESAGARWREDRTNATDAYFRNRVRRTVVPAWRKSLPAGADLASAVARSRAQLEEDEEALEAWALRVSDDSEKKDGSVAGWSVLPVAIVRRALHRWWMARVPGIELERGLADHLVTAIVRTAEQKFSAGACGFVVLEGGRLRLEPYDPASAETSFPGHPTAAPLPLPGTWRDPWGGVLTTELLSPARRREWARLARSADISQRVFLGSVMKQPGPLLVRRWQPGDRYQPFGTSHVSKLQDQFINRRIPRDARHRLPVVCEADGAIVWVPGIPPAEHTRVTPGSRSLVQLTYHPPHPRSHPQDV